MDRFAARNPHARLTAVSPRLDEATNAMARRLKFALELSICKQATSSICLVARWRDPLTGTVSDGVVSHLQEASSL